MSESEMKKGAWIISVCVWCTPHKFMGKVWDPNRTKDEETTAMCAECAERIRKENGLTPKKNK